MELLNDLFVTASLALFLSFLVAKLLSMVTATAPGHSDFDDPISVEDVRSGQSLTVQITRSQRKSEFLVRESLEKVDEIQVDSNLEIESDRGEITVESDVGKVDEFQDDRHFNIEHKRGCSHMVDSDVVEKIEEFHGEGHLKVGHSREEITVDSDVVKLPVISSEEKSGEFVCAANLDDSAEQSNKDRVEEISEESMVEKGIPAQSEVITAVKSDDQERDKEREVTVGFEDDWEGIERSELEKVFMAATEFIVGNDTVESIGSDVQMELYGLHKIATEGPCREPQPMPLKLSARAKWYQTFLPSLHFCQQSMNAWQKLGNMNPEVAMEQYVTLLSDKVPGWEQGNSAKHQITNMLIIFKLLLPIVLLLIFSGKFTIAANQTHQSKTTYIVHMDKSTMPPIFTDHLHWFDSSLRSVSHSAQMLYIYKHVIHGFSTRLTTQEANLLAKQPGVLSLIPERIYHLHTTRTPQFLRLDKAHTPTISLPASNKQSNVIIGLLDTGVWPERKSFDDSGLEPIPKRWKGACESGKNFNSSNCNRKLVGARSFYQGYEATYGPIDESTASKSPRDDEGHGTHTSSTAGGSVVPKASLGGYAFGTARGMATKARLAMYKVCWSLGCSGSDIAAGLDKAIEDGIDILSLSIGGTVVDYYNDVLAIGAFKATARGIFVSAAAGNSGPFPRSLCNIAPWMTTVGAGTIDRDFPAYVSLGNGKTYIGVSVYYGKPLPDSPLPLVYAGNATSFSTSFCTTGSLIPSKVSGKIVICDRGMSARAEKGLVVKQAGGVGMILANTKYDREDILADAHFIPAASLGEKSSDEVKKYAFSDPNPTARITFGGTKLGVQPSPKVAVFSSRGPNYFTPQILKPDVIAPGVNILAGWTGAVGPTGLLEDTRKVSFNIISGTSMSCPHVSGIAAFIKGVRPDWSPATIRSALVTTAYSTYKSGDTLWDVDTGKPATAFDFGAGHVDPLAALDPGLVYDVTMDDYMGFFCALNYTSEQIKQVTGEDFTCDSSKKYRVEDLNYPSFSASVKPGSSGPTIVEYTRSLTNVGVPATYNVSVSSQTPLLKIVVEPQTLTFSQVQEKKSFTVTFTYTPTPSSPNDTFGYLEWSDGKHKVRSPIAFFSWT
ncbi:subtilisin-like protease SBT1.7 [Senna tora]|uniref:Subtilisin-like protease SBT1.7 n=1 Tax=Senna tora TaxID=362788 RepID=A0A834TZT8_9FABA|nr:subtilisin-like protease SBT1.7 [Senna tora]